MKRLTALIVLLAVLLTLGGCAEKKQPETPAPEAPETAKPAEKQPAEPKPEKPAEPESGKPAPEEVPDPPLPETPEEPEEIEEVRSNYWGEPKDELIPNGGYGPLVPYLGRVLQVTGGETGGYSRYYYGLTVCGGSIVTEPVYSEISLLWAADRLLSNTYLPIYRLSHDHLFALAAADGSWITEEKYIDAFHIGGERILLLDQDGFSFFCDIDGNVVPTAFTESVNTYWGDNWRESMQNAIFSTTACYPSADGTGCVLIDFEAGTSKALPDVGECAPWYPEDDITPAANTEWSFGYIDRQGSWVIEPQFGYASPFTGGAASVLLGDRRVMINRDGDIAWQPEGQTIQMLLSEEIYFIELDENNILLDLRDDELNPISHPALGHRVAFSYQSLNWLDEDGNWKLWDGAQTRSVSLEEGLYPESLTDDRLTVWAGDNSRNPGGGGVYDIVKREWIVPVTDSGVYEWRDELTGEPWALVSGSNTIYRIDGQVIAEYAEPVHCVAGRITAYNKDNGMTGLLDENGDVLMRIPVCFDSDTGVG